MPLPPDKKEDYRYLDYTYHLYLVKSFLSPRQLINNLQPLATKRKEVTYMVTLFIMSLLVVAFFVGVMGYAAGTDKGYQKFSERHKCPKKEVYVEPPKQQTTWPVTHAQLLDPLMFAQHHGSFNTTTYREYCKE